MAFLVDTNVLVYRFDPRFPEKQRIATALMRAGIAAGTLRLAHQGVVEFVAAVTRERRGSRPSEDFQSGRRYGTVRIRDPFV